MKRPDVEEVLEPLKPFQRRTVDHAFERLFLASDSTARFLVADEVGLGKTLVARGVIARAIDHLWDDVKRIDVIYICSNGSIARANLSKLHVGIGEERSLALATRLTMLATELAPGDGGCGLSDGKVNFVSFTPGTSFSMGHSSGQWRERRVLFHLLEPFANSRTALMNLLQCGVRYRDWWRQQLTRVVVPLAEDVRYRFRQEVDADPVLKSELEEGLYLFRRYRKHWPPEARWQRNRLVARIRRRLATICVQALEPDLVILDEFQRFKSLLETRPDRQDQGAELAQSLFDATNPEGNPVRTLLLSATPYKLYTADAEIEDEEHYEDFLATTRFLLNDDEARVGGLRRRLASFGSLLRRFAVGEPGRVAEIETAKNGVEAALRAIMARTERTPASADRDAMVEECASPVVLTPADVAQYLASDALFRAVGSHDPMAYWKSAPYLAHFMHGYRFNHLLEDELEGPSPRVGEILEKHAAAFLAADSVRGWSKTDPGNGKLRTMVEDLLDVGLWRLLWIPPTLPYWPLEGPFAGRERATKTLLFSAWNVVPDAVAGLLSYEAERRMISGSRIATYDNPNQQQRPLLRLAHDAVGRPSRHRLLWLLLPCVPLADRAHPLAAPPDRDRRDWVRRRIEAVLEELPNPDEGPVDERWEWALPVLLDPGLRSFLVTWTHGELTASDGGPLERPNPDQFDAHVAELLALDSEDLGRRPPDLVDLLTEATLGSPAILAVRTLRSFGVAESACRRYAAEIALAFWHLFNQPAVISMIRVLYVEPEATGDEAAYWRNVLRYCQHGNLQAVLDEYWHLRWEQHAWSDDARREETAAICTHDLDLAIRPTRSRVHARFFERRADSRIATEEVRLRTVFALRFGHLPNEDGRGAFSQDAVREAFNSPFRPFVLSSTSIGQEGLDFHPWCHRLVHWDLPGNPVDLEQREGRIHRYKGHAVRRNVAAVHGQSALDAWSHGDVWRSIFELADEAARANGDSELMPWWLAAGEHRVQRHVPLLPHTREIELFDRLKRQLAAYRVVFGQPRQEELVTLLEPTDVDQLEDWTIDLSPPAAR